MKINNYKEYDFLKLMESFIQNSKAGKRLQKDGKRVRKSTIRGYETLRKTLIKFSSEKKVELRIKSQNKLGIRELKNEKKYWKEFYIKFTNFLYDDLDCYDNYVGTLINRLRAFFNYLNEEKDLNTGDYHKSFYSPKEEIEIITLSPEQLNYLIYSTDFEERLPEHLIKTKDIFVFGCTVALRASDILDLNTSNIEALNGKHYLKVTSLKTTTFTRILLPEYSIKIIQKYRSEGSRLFPKYSLSQFNQNVKKLIEKTDWHYSVNKVRYKRGVPVSIYKNIKTKTPFRFCDLITSHTMRRTAITTMLCLNMPETIVRKISGHAPGSKEFYKYVQLSQKYIDHESEKIFDQIKLKEFAPI